MLTLSEFMFGCLHVGDADHIRHCLVIPIHMDWTRLEKIIIFFDLFEI